MRIDFEEVLTAIAAARADGYKIITCTFDDVIDGQKCCCPLMALYFFRANKKERPESIIEYFSKRGYTTDYIWAWISGVDGGSWDHHNEEGLADGRRVRENL